MKGLLILLTLGCLLDLGKTALIKRKNTKEDSPTKVQELRELLDYLKKSVKEDGGNSDDDGGISFERVEGKGENKQKNGNGGGGRVPVNVFTSGSDNLGTNQNKKRTFEQTIFMEKKPVQVNRRALSSEAAEFLKVHNDKRRIVSPKATNMREMVWDEGLETLARNYAKQCNFKHNALRSQSMGYYVGENLYVSSGNNSPEVAVTFWDNEKNDYDFANNVCDPNSEWGCGHYTQVAWAESEKVGCAKQYCSAVTNFGSNWPGYLYVCNYGPGGNVNNRRPFSAGTTSCSDCPSGYTCVDRLCSKSSGGSTNPCETNPCQNGGTCTSASGQVVCKCTTGWTGSSCQNQETTTNNPCSTNPCKNGGSCSVDGDKALCQCASGWSGGTCETSNSQVTGSITISCNFEIGFCLNNYATNGVDFNLYKYFMVNGVTITAAEGSVFALAYASYVQSTTYSYLMSGVLPAADMTVSFKYRVSGSAQLAFVYFTEETSYVSTVIQVNTSSGWQNWTGNIPSGKEAVFYFEAALTSYSLVAIDDVRYGYSYW